MTHPFRGNSVSVIVGAFAALIAATPIAVPAQAVGVKILPSAARVSWDGALAITDDWLYGGRVALTFGRLIELQPFFFRGQGVGVDSARARGIAGATLFPREFDIDHYGATAQLNLGVGDLVPFIRVGGGIIRFQSDSTPDRRRVTALAGGGLRLKLGGLSGELFAEQFHFRLLPSRLFSADTTTLTPGQRAPTQRNRAYGASVTIPLSSFPETSGSDALRGTRAPLEPFVGRLRYAGDLNLEDQDLIGLRAGIDLNSLVGVRAFYWRGVRDFDAVDDVSGYGAEAQFSLGAGSGITPYLITGAGRIDFDSDFRDPQGMSRQDQTALILGGGASLSLSERIRLNVAIRDFITTSDDELLQARNPDDLLHNRLLSAGLTWSLGGQTSDAARRERDRRMRDQRERGSTERDRELERLRMENDSLMGIPRSERSRPGSAERRRARNRDVREERSRLTYPRGMTPADTGARFIVIPVPTIGEIIIRYGAIGTTPMENDTTQASRTGTSRDTTTATRATTTDSGNVAEQLAAMERRLALRMDSLSRRTDEQALERERAAAAPARSVDTVRVAGRDSPVPGTTFIGRLSQVRPSNMSVFAGYGSGDGSQLVLDARANLGPLSPGSRFTLVPEISLGLGGDRTTFLAAANLRYDLLDLGAFRPYVMGGAGVFSRTLIGVVTSVGASTDLRGGRGTPLNGFVEVQGINLFDRTRVLFGISSLR